MSELTEDQKLVKLGLRSPNQTQSSGAEVFEILKNNIAEEWATFQELFDDANLSSWSDFETWLTNNGISTSTASNIRSNFEAKYSSFSDFKSKILNEYTSWEDFANDFASNTGLRSDRRNADGLAAAGLKFYEEAGVGRNGQSIPAGGAELYASEVHFSETTTVQDTKDESSGTDDPTVWDNLVVDPNTAFVGDTIDVEADVTNNTGFEGSVVAELIVDNTVKRKETYELGGNTTITVSFDYSAGEDGTGTFDIGISKAGTEQVEVNYAGL